MATTESTESTETTETTETTDVTTAACAPQIPSPQGPAIALTKIENRPGPLARPLGTISLMRRLFRDQEWFTGLDRQRGEGQRRGPDRELGRPTFIPTVEIMHRDDKLIANVDLPGLSARDIRVTVEERALVIEGERRSEHAERDGEVWRNERSYGRFRRVIPLPRGADTETAEARFDNGVLEVVLRAPQHGQGRQLEIKTGGAQPDGPRSATPG